MVATSWHKKAPLATELTPRDRTAPQAPLLPSHYLSEQGSQSGDFQSFRLKYPVMGPLARDSPRSHGVERRGDLSKIDLERLREEFSKKVTRKATAIQDIRDIVEKRLAEMLASNPTRMDYQRKYEEIIADYNREKDRTTIEETFRRLVELVNSLDEEQKRATREGLREDELALFDLLQKDGLTQTARERVKQASRELLASIKARWQSSIASGKRSRRRPRLRCSSWTTYLLACRHRHLRRKKRSSLRPMCTPTFGNRR
jgi:Domain of unknown function (DUF3387)